MRMDGRADGQTDMTELIVAFHNCVNAPENWSEIPLKNLDNFSSYSSNYSGADVICFGSIRLHLIDLHIEHYFFPSLPERRKPTSFRVNGRN